MHEYLHLKSFNLKGRLYTYSLFERYPGQILIHINGTQDATPVTRKGIFFTQTTCGIFQTCQVYSLKPDIHVVHSGVMFKQKCSSFPLVIYLQLELHASWAEIHHLEKFQRATRNNNNMHKPNKPPWINQANPHA